MFILRCRNQLQSSGILQRSMSQAGFLDHVSLQMIQDAAFILCRAHGKHRTRVTVRPRHNGMHTTAFLSQTPGLDTLSPVTHAVKSVCHYFLVTRPFLKGTYY